MIEDQKSIQDRSRDISILRSFRRPCRGWAPFSGWTAAAVVRRPPKTRWRTTIGSPRTRAYVDNGAREAASRTRRAPGARAVLCSVDWTGRQAFSGLAERRWRHGGGRGGFAIDVFSRRDCRGWLAAGACERPPRGGAANPVLLGAQGAHRDIGGRRVGRHCRGYTYRTAPRSAVASTDNVCLQPRRAPGARFAGTENSCAPGAGWIRT